MKVGVIGAGTMGSGIAQTFAQCDAVETVYLCDIKQEFADGGKAKIEKGLMKRVEKGKLDKEVADNIIGKIQTGLNTKSGWLGEVSTEVMDVIDCHLAR